MGVKIKMDYFVNLELKAGSRYYTKEKPVLPVGIRSGTFYIDGSPSKVVSQTEINRVFMIKEGVYTPVDLDTFIAFYRNSKKAA